MSPPRIDSIVVAGLGGDSGKSLLAIGLIGALRRRGLEVAPFKKGPDFIDAAWLGRAAGRAGRNLDTYLMSPSAILSSINARWNADIAVVEGNRGLFDGMTAKGAHSTATLARLIGAPVLLIVDVTKSTRTIAALVKGCQLLEADLSLGGVVLNRVATKRQEAIIREAVEDETGIAVVGAIYREKASLLPSRHLGLLTATEHPDVASALETATDIVAHSVDIDAVVRLSRGRRPDSRTPVSDAPFLETPENRFTGGKAPTKIGLLKDNAFSFYYPENLEALEAAGADLVPLSPIDTSTFPEDIDGLYAGGGFPEVYAEALSRNRTFRSGLLARIEAGLPVFAECGGLMYLSRSLIVDGSTFPMVGALPLDVAMHKRPRGHGYVSGVVQAETPFFPKGATVRGHEFHYSEIISDTAGLDTVLALERGVGIDRGRDGILVHNVVAFYTHFHALGVPSWAEGFINAIEKKGVSQGGPAT